MQQPHHDLIASFQQILRDFVIGSFEYGKNSSSNRAVTRNAINMHGEQLVQLLDFPVITKYVEDTLDETTEKFKNSIRLIQNAVANGEWTTVATRALRTIVHAAKNDDVLEYAFVPVEEEDWKVKSAENFVAESDPDSELAARPLMSLFNTSLILLLRCIRGREVLKFKEAAELEQMRDDLFHELQKIRALLREDVVKHRLLLKLDTNDDRVLYGCLDLEFWREWFYHPKEHESRLKILESLLQQNKKRF